MYYQNYDDYMRDVFYFNQMPMQNMNYPYMGYNGQNPNFQPNNFNNGNSNINNMYPSIYRIVQPVVSRVVTGNNYGYLTDDNLNSMVDTVYNIVEGEALSNSTENDLNSNNNMQSSTSAANSTINQRNNSTSTTQTTATSPTNASSRNNDSRNILRDLIRILLIKEIINRNNIRRFNNNYNNFQNMSNMYDQRYVF